MFTVAPVVFGLDKFFGLLTDWEQYLAPMWTRNLDSSEFCWCAQWWRHLEGVTRLDAMWRSWELMRLDAATGMSSWLRDVADHHMGVLTSPLGPFAYCTDDHADRLQGLPAQPAPRDVFYDGGAPR